MTSLFLDNLYLTILLPLWLFLIIMIGRFFSVYVNKLLIYILTLLSSLFGIIISSGALYKLSADKIIEIHKGYVNANKVMGTVLENIPEDATMLLIASPSLDLSESDVKKIDEFFNISLSEDTKHPRNRSDRGMLKSDVRGL